MCAEFCAMCSQAKGGSSQTVDYEWLDKPDGKKAFEEWLNTAEGKAAKKKKRAFIRAMNDKKSGSDPDAYAKCVRTMIANQGMISPPRDMQLMRGGALC